VEGSHNVSLVNLAHMVGRGTLPLQEKAPDAASSGVPCVMPDKYSVLWAILLNGTVQYLRPLQEPALYRLR
jgi:hypothetical protein